MRIATVFISVLLLAAPAARAQVDCSTARCTFDQAVNSKCSCGAASNHGKYVSCVAHLVNDLTRCGLLPTNCKGKVTRCAARSTCGKDGAQTCTPTCVTDPVTGALVCSDDPTQSCATDADCGKCHIRRNGDCPAGTTASTGSCCPTCAPPTCTSPAVPGCPCTTNTDCASGNCCTTVGVCG